MSWIRRSPAAADVSPNDRVSACWAQAADPTFRTEHERRNWMGHPDVQRYINRRCSGDPTRTWLDHFVTTWTRGRRLHNVLNLGCGEGALEANLIARNFAASYVGYDLSEACIARANDTIARAHPEAQFHCTDVNRITLPERAFDVAVFSHALHHIECLEHVLGQVRRALRPDGFLIFEEFIGPNRMQWTTTQLRLINGMLDALAPRLRRDLTRTDDVAKPPVVARTVREWLAADPSECVRSADIMRVADEHFEILDRRDFGGTLLQTLLENICGNFDPTHDADASIVRLMIAVEETLIDTGVIPSDFTFVVARPRL